MPRRAPASLPLLIVLLATLAAGPARADWTATGRCLFQDRPFNREGYTGEITLKPVRCAIVQVVDSSRVKNNVLASGITGEDGSFAVRVPDDSVRTVYVRVVAAAADTNRYRLSIEAPASGSRRVPVTMTGPMMSGHHPGADLRVFDGRPMVAAVANAGAAFHALDVLETGVDYVAALTGGARPRRALVLSLEGVGGMFHGSLEGASTIEIEPGRAYDDCLVLHEEGHHFEHEFSRLGEGGAHDLGETDQPLSQAWGEGWATYFQGCVRRNRGEPDAEFYVDLLGSSEGRGFGFAFNLESPPWNLTGAASEAVVQCILWDISDGTDGRGGHLRSDDDPMFLPEGATWDVFSRYLGRSAGPPTLERFWDGWFERGWAREAQIRAIFERFRVEMRGDSLEDDGWAARAREMVPGAAYAHHTLFPAGDRDWVRFQAVAGQAYLVETTGLVGRCATRLTLFGPDTSRIISTATAFTGNDLSSSIQFTAGISGTHYVRCEHDPNPWSGEYGSYDLRIAPVGPAPEYRVVHDFAREEFIPSGMIAAGDSGFHLWGRAATASGTRGRVMFADTAGNVRVVHEFRVSDGLPLTLAALPGGAVAGIVTGGSPDSAGAREHLFRLDRDGGYTELLGFNGAVGRYPRPSLAVSREGDIYGATELGGEFGDGSLFRCDASGKVSVVRALDYSGTGLAGGPVADTDGTVYAMMRSRLGGLSDSLDVWLVRVGTDTTLARGYDFPVSRYMRCVTAAAPNGGVAVMVEGDPGVELYRVDPGGSVRRQCAISDQRLEYSGYYGGGMIAGSDGRIFGFWSGSGGQGGGLYRLDPSGAMAGLRTFHARDSYSDLDGRRPVAVAEGPRGSLFGMTREGGPLGAGVLFRLDGAMATALASVPAPVARPTHAYVEVEWTARLDGILAFQLERATAPEGPFQPVVLFNGGGNVLKRFRDGEVRPGTEYLYRVAYRMVPTEPWAHSPVTRVLTPTAVFALQPPTPNPATGAVRIRYEMSRRADARIEIFDVAGRVVRTLWNGPLEAGTGMLVWNGANARGETVGSGVFFLRLASGEESRVRKLVRVH